jgi:hypothetical protein
LPFAHPGGKIEDDRNGVSRLLLGSFEQITGQFEQQRRLACSWFSQNEQFALSLVVDFSDACTGR